MPLDTDILTKQVYEPSEYGRIIPAVLIDSRIGIPQLANKTGNEIKAYCDIEINKVKENPYVLFFRIETIKTVNTIQEMEDGVLAGYFSLFLFHQGQTANIYQFQLRPAFMQFNVQISAEITNFITSGSWKQYVLL